MTRGVMSVLASAAGRRSFAGFPRTVAVKSRPRQAGTSRIVHGIKGLLFGQGIRGINVKKHYKTLAPAELVTGDGRLAIAVNDAEIVLGVGVTLLGGLQIPPRHPR